jgi:hypothetical protein
MILKRLFLIIFLFLFLIIISCENNKFPLPEIPSTEEQFGNTGKEVYVQINPPLDAANGYTFKKPADVFFGADNLVYVADTENDRIVMLDAGGAVQGFSQTIPHPEAITQDDSLRLLIVNKTNAVFRINLFKYNHIIGNAPVEEIYRQDSEPSRQFTGITVHNGFQYYVTVLDVADSSLNTVEFSFIYDFAPDQKTLRGPLPLFVNGTGLNSAVVPTGIVSLRERFLDISVQEVTPAYIFCQRGKTRLIQNNFKVQVTTTTIVEGGEIVIPNVGLIGSDIYDVNKYYFPEDVAIDRSGFILVVEKGRAPADPDTTKPLPGFYRFAPSGLELQATLGLGSGVLQFNEPKGIAVSPFQEEQIVYVADTGNDRVVLLKLSTDF